MVSTGDRGPDHAGVAPQATGDRLARSLGIAAAAGIVVPAGQLVALTEGRSAAENLAAQEAVDVVGAGQIGHPAQIDHPAQQTAGRCRASNDVVVVAVGLGAAVGIGHGGGEGGFARTHDRAVASQNRGVAGAPADDVAIDLVHQAEVAAQDLARAAGGAGFRRAVKLLGGEQGVGELKGKGLLVEPAAIPPLGLEGRQHTAGTIGIDRRGQIGTIDHTRVQIDHTGCGRRPGDRGSIPILGQHQRLIIGTEQAIALEDGIGERFSIHIAGDHLVVQIGAEACIGGLHQINPHQLPLVGDVQGTWTANQQVFGQQTIGGAVGHPQHILTRGIGAARTGDDVVQGRLEIAGTGDGDHVTEGVDIAARRNTRTVAIGDVEQEPIHILIGLMWAVGIVAHIQQPGVRHHDLGAGGAGGNLGAAERIGVAGLDGDRLAKIAQLQLVGGRRGSGDGIAATEPLVADHPVVERIQIRGGSGQHFADRRLARDRDAARPVECTSGCRHCRRCGVKGFAVAQAIDIAGLHREGFAHVAVLDCVAGAGGASDGCSSSQPLVADMISLEPIGIGNQGLDCLAHHQPLARAGGDGQGAGAASWRRGGSTGDAAGDGAGDLLGVTHAVAIAGAHLDGFAKHRFGEQQRGAGGLLGGLGLNDRAISCPGPGDVDIGVVVLIDDCRFEGFTYPGGAAEIEPDAVAAPVFEVTITTGAIIDAAEPGIGNPLGEARQGLVIQHAVVVRKLNRTT